MANGPTIFQMLLVLCKRILYVLCRHRGRSCVCSEANVGEELFGLHVRADLASGRLDRQLYAVLSRFQRPLLAPSLPRMRNSQYSQQGRAQGEAWGLSPPPRRRYPILAPDSQPVWRALLFVCC